MGMRCARTFELQVDALVDQPLAVQALGQADSVSRSTVGCSSTPARTRCST